MKIVGVSLIVVIGYGLFNHIKFSPTFPQNSPIFQKFIHTINILFWRPVGFNFENTVSD